MLQSYAFQVPTGNRHSAFRPDAIVDQLFFRNLFVISIRIQPKG
jgi:hypothetical protein